MVRSQSVEDQCASIWGTRDQLKLRPVRTGLGDGEAITGVEHEGGVLQPRAGTDEGPAVGCESEAAAGLDFSRCQSRRPALQSHRDTLPSSSPQAEPVARFWPSGEKPMAQTAAWWSSIRATWFPLAPSSITATPTRPPLFLAGQKGRPPGSAPRETRSGGSPETAAWIETRAGGTAHPRP